MSAKKRHHQNTLILGLVASLGGLAVPAQAQDAATKTLIEQGQYWQSRGDAQRAIDSWQKLLRVDPNQPDALTPTTAWWNGCSKTSACSATAPRCSRRATRPAPARPSKR